VKVFKFSFFTFLVSWGNVERSMHRSTLLSPITSGVLYVVMLCYVELTMMFCLIIIIIILTPTISNAP